MKKFTVLMLAALLVVAFAMPASALENIFGGYWRTRFFQQRNFAGDDTQGVEEDFDNVMVDTRTRLKYTAKLNDNLKLVNEFEMNSNWGSGPVAGFGGTASYGDSGTDAMTLMIRQSYADFNVGPVNFIVGAQEFKLARGFISDDTGIGMKAIWKINDGLYIPFVWNKMLDGNDSYTVALANGEDLTRFDIDMYILSPIIMLSKDIKINPYYVFAHSQNATFFGTTLPAYGAGSFDNVNAHWFGADFDGKFGPASIWFTGVLQRGDATATGTAATATAGITAKKSIKMKGYLAALGGAFDLGKADIHGQAFIASGDDANIANAGAAVDESLTDKKASAFLTVGATSYYWAEIMGLGIFDQQTCIGSPGNKITNIIAANLGTTIKPTAKLSISADLWWARLKEENALNEKKLGIEADLKVTYQLVEGLSLDIVGAYLFAGDAVSVEANGNENDPYEFGTRLSLSF